MYGLKSNYVGVNRKPESAKMKLARSHDAGSLSGLLVVSKDIQHGHLQKQLETRRRPGLSVLFGH